MTGVSKQIEEALKRKPFIVEALRLGIANISAIAKLLQEELKLESTRTARSAIENFAETLTKTDRMGRIIALLAKSKLIMRSNMSDVTINIFPGIETSISKLHERFDPTDILHYIKGESVITLILDESNLNDVQEIFGAFVDKVRHNLVQLSIISSPEVENTPGWVSYLSGVLALNDINIVELLSFFSDTIFIVKQEDANNVFSVLNSLLRENSAIN